MFHVKHPHRRINDSGDVERPDCFTWNLLFEDFGVGGAASGLASNFAAWHRMQIW